MPLNPNPTRRLAALALAALATGLAVGLLPATALAGRAQVGIQMGTYANTDLDSATASGQSWRDGQPLQALSDAAALPFKDWASVSLRVDSGTRSNMARAEVQAQAQLRGSGQLFSGDGMVASDVGAGTLALQWRSDLARDLAAPQGLPREGYARGYPFSELWETFEVVYPIDRLAPVQVSLTMVLDGRLDGNVGGAGPQTGVEAYLSLGGVDTGENHLWLDPIWRSETSVNGTQLTFSGALQSTGCSVVRNLCSGFVSLYAALDMRGRLPGAGPDSWQPAQAPVDLSFSAQLALQVSDGVTLVRGDVSDALPAVGWAQVTSVPEPGSLALMLAGLTGLACYPRRRVRGRTVGWAAVALCALWPAVGSAQTWQLSASLLANAIQFSPGPGVTVSHVDNLSLLNLPSANQLQLRSEFSQTPVGGVADARFAGQIGLLKAFAAASNPYCCDLLGHTLTSGYTNATVEGRFYDTVLVQGAGLAVGTPVSYRIDLDISGSLSRPAFEMGGFLSVDGLAEVRLRDLTSFADVSLSWNAAKDAPGRYALTLNTQVGHSLGVSGMLYAGAYVSSYAQLGRSAEADFYHSAAYSLAPSVAGLNTVGASGHDFLAPVPELSTWAAMLLGLATLGGLARIRRCGLAAC